MHSGRALMVALGALVLAILAYSLRETGGQGWMPPCIIKETTGFSCPGCGMTRGASAMLNGRIAEAFLYNPVGMVLLPIGMLALAVELAAWIKSKRVSVWPGRRGVVGLTAVIICWWVIRNVFGW